MKILSFLKLNSIKSLFLFVTLLFIVILVSVSFHLNYQSNLYNEKYELLLSNEKYISNISGLYHLVEKSVKYTSIYFWEKGERRKEDVLNSLKEINGVLKRTSADFPEFENGEVYVVVKSYISFIENSLNGKHEIAEVFVEMDNVINYLNKQLVSISRDNIAMLEQDVIKFSQTQKFFYVIYAPLLLVLIVFIFLPFNRNLNNDIKKFIMHIERIVKEKDFSHELQKSHYAELMKINKSISNMITIVKDMLFEFSHHSSELAAFAQQLSASSQEVSSATEEVSSSTENISGDIMLLKDFIDSMNSTVVTLNTLMDETSRFLDKQKGINEEFIKLMDAETTMIVDSSNKFELMEDSLNNVKLFIDDFSGQVNTIQVSVDSIKAIHKKIELLSLNAAIEAARAGKEGGGFAVIAEEIRNLSSKSAEASGEIEKIMSEVISNIKQLHNLVSVSIEGFIKIQSDWNDISDISSKVNNESQSTYKETENLSARIKKIEKEFITLKKIFNDIKIRMDSIVSSSEEISSSNEEISSQMEELTASSEELSEKAGKIRHFIDNYKI